MARPIKLGLEYFPEDTTILSDRKIKRLIKGWGASGFLVYHYLRCLIYSEKGYYMHVDNDLVFDIADELGMDESDVKDKIDGCLSVNLFSQYMYDNLRIITSAGIQKRYLKVKPKAVINKQMMVIDEETKQNTKHDAVIEQITTVNSEETTVINETIPQRKEKERKEKERKENNLTQINQQLFEKWFLEFTEPEEQIWLEEMSMKLKTGSVENTKKLLREFLENEKLAEKLLGRDRSDLKKHFLVWSLKKQFIQQPMDSAQKNKTIQGYQAAANETKQAIKDAITANTDY